VVRRDPDRFPDRADAGCHAACLPSVLQGTLRLGVEKLAGGHEMERHAIGVLPAQ